MGRRLRSPRLPGVDVPGVDASMSPRPQPRRAMRWADVYVCMLADGVALRNRCPQGQADPRAAIAGGASGVTMARAGPHPRRARHSGPGTLGSDTTSADDGPTSPIVPISARISPGALSPGAPTIHGPGGYHVHFLLGNSPKGPVQAGPLLPSIPAADCVIPEHVHHVPAVALGDVP